jgi:hypothetical protein
MKRFYKLLIIAAIIAAPCITIAQGPPDPGGGYNNGDPDETPIPFDGGLTLLVAAGIGYGLKQARKQKKEKEII